MSTSIQLSAKPGFRKRKRKKTSDKSSGLSMFTKAKTTKTTKSTKSTKSTTTTTQPHKFQASSTSIRKAKEQHAAALALDPNIFDFDAHLSKREEEAHKSITNLGGGSNSNTNSNTNSNSNSNSNNSGGSRYIGNMLKKTELRKKEQDRAYNKMQRRKADQESAAYGDTEKFVTPAYKAMLEKEQVEEEQELRQEIEDRKSSGGVGSFLLNVTQQSVKSNEKEDVPEASSIASGSTSSSSSSSSSSTTPTTSTTSTSSTIQPNRSSIQQPQPPQPPALSQQELVEQARLQAIEEEAARDAAEEQKTGEKVAAARARYMLRKAQRAAAQK